MSAKDNKKKEEKQVFERGKGLPIDHPKNCAHECPYGYDRALAKARSRILAVTFALVTARLTVLLATSSFKVFLLPNYIRGLPQE